MVVSTDASAQQIHKTIHSNETLAPQYNPPWPFKKAPVITITELDNGKLPLWRRLFMSAVRRRRIAEASVAYEDVDPSTISLLDEKSKEYEKTPVRRQRRGGRTGKIILAIPVLILSFFGLIHLTNIFLNLGPILWDSEVPDFLPHWGQPGQLGDGLSSYPTDFLRDVHPIPCHSHNDYWRRVPLFEALRYGCTGVEADVWIFDDELYVGHNTAALTPNRTLRALYLDPLLATLDQLNSAAYVFANAADADVSASSSDGGSTAPLGIWDVDPTQTLALLIDFKNDGELIWPVLSAQLDALRARGYLTHFNGSAVVQRPVTVVATGSAPFELLVANAAYRDVFFDAPLELLWEDPDAPYAASSSSSSDDDEDAGTQNHWPDPLFNPTTSFYASTSFKKSIGYPLLLPLHSPLSSLSSHPSYLTDHQSRLIRGQIRGATRRGLKARYWSAPAWPLGVRNAVWETLVAEGVGALNVDDLRGASGREWGRRGRGREGGWWGWLGL